MSFTMQVVNEEDVKAAIEEEIKPIPEEIAKLKVTADNNVAQIMSLNTESLGARKEILQSIESFGSQTLKTSSQKNSLLQVTVGHLSKTGDEGGQVAKDLGELQLTLKDLDPSVIDFAKKGILGKIFNPIRSYFQKYEKADEVISDIVASLDKGRTTLKNDNTTLEIEQQALRLLTKTLEKEIKLGTLMDEAIESHIDKAKIQGEDPEKIRFITEEILFLYVKE